MTYEDLSQEQQNMITEALHGNNILVEYLKNKLGISQSIELPIVFEQQDQKVYVSRKYDINWTLFNKIIERVDLMSINDNKFNLCNLQKDISKLILLHKVETKCLVLQINWNSEIIGYMWLDDEYCSKT